MILTGRKSSRGLLIITLFKRRGFSFVDSTVRYAQCKRSAW